MIFQQNIVYLRPIGNAENLFKSRLNKKISEMKTKLLTLALFGILTFISFSCSQEEIAPSNEIELNENLGQKSVHGGVTTRDPR